MKVDLPSGGWASLREPGDVPERLRRPVARLTKKLILDPSTRLDVGMSEADVSTDQFDIMEEMNDLLIVALVQEWSYEAAISVEAAQELPGRDYDFLRETTAKHVMGLFPNFAPDGDKGSPTTP